MTVWRGLSYALLLLLGGGCAGTSTGRWEFIERNSRYAVFGGWQRTGAGCFSRPPWIDTVSNDCGTLWLWAALADDDPRKFPVHPRNGQSWDPDCSFVSVPGHDVAGVVSVEWMDRPLECCFQSLSPKDVFCVLATLPDVNIAIDPEALRRVGNRRRLPLLITSTVETKYVLSWAAHLSELQLVRRGSGLQVTAQVQAGRTDSIPEYFKETEGKWQESLNSALDSVVTIDLDAVIAIDAIHLVSPVTGLPILVDPQLWGTDQLSTRITRAGQSGTCRDVLTSILEELHLSMRLQGGLVVISCPGPASSRR